MLYDDPKYNHIDSEYQMPVTNSSINFLGIIYILHKTMATYLNHKLLKILTFIKNNLNFPWASFFIYFLAFKCPASKYLDSEN